MPEGRVVAIHIAAIHGEPPRPVGRVQARAGKGLEGNRHFFDGGAAPPGNALTLIAEEAVEAFSAETGIPFTARESRRNLATRGIDLNALVGRRFRVGRVECVGVELCEPCSHLASMTHAEVLRGMVHRGGLNADVLTDGEIVVGDAVRPAD